jgi:S1-C subfamily serine protease
MYISPKWVYANADLLTQTNPVGTGQYDFALLAVTGSANSAALPPIFPSVSLSTESPSIGTPVTIASYGAQYLPPSQIKSGLFPTIVSDTVRDVFTYAVNSVDIFELGGSAAAQEGSSGGGVVNDKGSLVGMLTTSSLDANTSIRTLDAITASYIRAEYVDETGQSLDSLFDQSPTVTVAGFSSRVPALEALINAHLP